MSTQEQNDLEEFKRLARADREKFLAADAAIRKLNGMAADAPMVTGLGAEVDSVWAELLK